MGNKYTMKLSDAITEHKDLVNVLEKNDRKEELKELSEQGAELKEMLAKKESGETKPVKKVKEVPRPDFTAFGHLPKGSLHEAAGVKSGKSLSQRKLLMLSRKHDDEAIRNRAKLTLQVAQWRASKSKGLDKAAGLSQNVYLEKIAEISDISNGVVVAGVGGAIGSGTAAVIHSRKIAKKDMADLRGMMGGNLDSMVHTTQGLDDNMDFMQHVRGDTGPRTGHIQDATHNSIHLGQGNHVNPLSGHYSVGVSPVEKDISGRVTPIITSGKVNLKVSKEQFASDVVHNTQEYAKSIGRTFHPHELEKLRAGAIAAHANNSKLNVLRKVPRKLLGGAALGGAAAGVALYKLRRDH